MCKRNEVMTTKQSTQRDQRLEKIEGIARS